MRLNNHQHNTEGQPFKEFNYAGARKRHTRINHLNY
jgi:hypothetical protein